MDIANNTSRKTLYLSRASQLDRTFAKTIYRFFAESFVLSYYSEKAEDIELKFNIYKPILLKALQGADSDILDIGMEKTLEQYTGISVDVITEEISVKKQDKNKLKFTTYHRYDPATSFDLQAEESDGTQILFKIMLNLIEVLQNDRILLIDEIENSLHTRIVEYIISLFHHSNSAQLIYTTHNTHLLDLDKLRKDQIYFTNKRADGSSDLYSLFDYKDFRDTMDAEKGYLQGRFDAIPYISNYSMDWINEK